MGTDDRFERFGRKRIKSMRWEKTRSNVWTATAVILLGVVFVVAVYQFRKPDEPQDEKLVTPITDVFVPTKGPLSVPEEGLFPYARQAELFSTVSGASVGYAYRGTRGGRYFVDVLSPLPEIDREKQFYQVWLVRPIPYDFFSAGEMVTNDLSQFVLTWEGEEAKEYGGYTRVVITLEAYEGPEGPHAHVVEGEFRDQNGSPKNERAE